MIPDKIYFNPKFDIPQREKECSDDIEYIRKDALLEWAEDWKDSGPIKDSADNGDAWSIGYLSAMADIIMKLNSL